MRKRALVLAAAVTAFTPLALAQPRGGILQVSLVNGTTGGDGAAEKVTLLRLEGGMVPVAELDDVEGTFEIRDIEVEGQRPMLLQVTYGGVNYNEPVNFGRGYEARVQVTVYEPTPSWEQAQMQIQEARFLYRRQGPSLLVDRIFIVRNRSTPPVTYYDPAGSFRLALPSEGLEQLNSVSARGESGMPVPQQASPLPDGAGYSTKTSFKPGETTIAVSYQVGYGDERYAVSETSFYEIPELYVFVAPADVAIEAPGWELLGPEPEGRYVAMRKANVAPGDLLSFELSGGSEASEIQTSSGGGGEQGASGGGGSGTVTVVPDTSISAKWVLVVLMAAALGYGLLATLYPSSSGSGSERRGDS